MWRCSSPVTTVAGNLVLAIALLGGGPVAGEANAAAKYVGSHACQMCHPAISARWQKTPMANVVRDQREHPDAILPDLSQPNPLVRFTRDQVALVYGSIWKQRYFTRIGKDYYVEPAQWDVAHREWLP